MYCLFRHVLIIIVISFCYIMYYFAINIILCITFDHTSSHINHIIVIIIIALHPHHYVPYFAK